MILGIQGDSAHRPERGSHDSGAALIDAEGRVIAAANEERFTRIKQEHRYPFQSIAYVLSLGDRSQVEIAAIPWLSPRAQKPRLDQLFAHLAELGREDAFLKRFWWRQQWPRWARLMRKNRRTLPSEIAHARLLEVEHHRAHAASAYFCCPWTDQPVLVITLDGQGDFAAATVWRGEDGQLAQLAEYDALNSIGHIYAAFTGFLGFTPNRHEGKVVGLAAHGNPEPLRSRLLAHTHMGRWHRLLSPKLVWIGLRPSDARADKAMHSLSEGLSREDIAAGVQAWCEEVVCAFVRDWVRRTGIRKLALAGGVFANVKLNQRILELDEVENIYIHPNMGDGGLAVGAALAALAETRGSLPPRFLQTVYLGPEITEEEAKAALEAHGLAYERPQNLAKAIAELLAAGKVVARAAGRMEYGPRALGNRSILASCSDPSINDWLNKRLNRTEFMPFAPVVLEQFAKDYFPAWKPEHVAARFMTITYDASEKAKQEIPAAIHVDGTARPQVLRKQDNPDFYAILQAYHEKTGIPALINTSFNMHEEPIVCSANDAVRAFLQGNLDALALGPFLCVR